MAPLLLPTNQRPPGHTSSIWNLLITIFQVSEGEKFGKIIRH